MVSTKLENCMLLRLPVLDEVTEEWCKVCQPSMIECFFSLWDCH
jgi:hypothetical protein